MNKIALRGCDIKEGDTLTDCWWFPDGRGTIEALSPYLTVPETLMKFAGAGSQVAKIVGVGSYRLTLPAINWYIVERPN